MKKQENNVEVTEIVETEVAVEEVKESKVKNFISKTGGFIKKHGVKIALGAGAVLGTGLLVVKAIRKGEEQEALDYLAEDGYDGDEYAELVEMETEAE